jgi:hypothetical protein
MWPERPDPFSVVVGERVSADGLLALNTTIFGEGYGNFGYGAFVLVPLSFLMMQFFFSILRRRSMYTDLSSFFIALAMIRFDFSYACIALVCLLVFTNVARAKLMERQAGPTSGPPNVRPALPSNGTPASPAGEAGS